MMSCTRKQVAARIPQRGTQAGSAATKHGFGRNASAAGRRIHFLTKCVFVCFAVMLCVGCGREKEELEFTKLQVDRLASENKKMAEASAGLEQEKLRLSDEVKLLSAKSEGLQNEVVALKKAKASADDENAQLKKKIDGLQSEMNALKLQKTDLERERDELKKKSADQAQASPAQGKDRKGPEVATPAAREQTKPSESLTPCDAVVAFMKRSEGIIRNHKGEQRRKLLEQVKRELTGPMRGAPDKAVKAANSWVNELSKGWDKPGDDIVFKLLSKRNAVLDACGKKPEEVGF